MFNKTHLIKAWHPIHGLNDISIEVRRLDNDYFISCALPLTDELLTSQASDCFAALQGIRRKAEGRKWKICCKGARQNAWPSAMSRDMGGGIMAYVHEAGRQGRADTMVNIFEQDEPESYATVSDQESYARAWFDSLRLYVDNKAVQPIGAGGPDNWLSGSRSDKRFGYGIRR